MKKLNKIRKNDLDLRIIDVGIGFLYESDYPKIKLIFADPKKKIIDEKFNISYYYNRENVVEVDDTTTLFKLKELTGDEDGDKS